MGYILQSNRLLKSMNSIKQQQYDLILKSSGPKEIDSEDDSNNTTGIGRKNMTVKIVWGITGAGDLIQETVAVMHELVTTMELKVTIVLSKAGIQVVKWYKLANSLDCISDSVQIEKDANRPFIVGPLQTGKYDGLLVAPATANTVAKIVTGIADTLITNAVAQTNKSRVPIFILPVDLKSGTTVTKLPNGKDFTLTMRALDVENTHRLGAMEGIRVLKTSGEIVDVIGRLRSIKGQLNE